MAAMDQHHVIDHNLSCQEEDEEALQDLLGEATRAEHDPNGEEHGNEDISDDDIYVDVSDPKPLPPRTEIPASQFSPGRSDVQHSPDYHPHAGSFGQFQLCA